MSRRKPGVDHRRPLSLERQAAQLVIPYLDLRAGEDVEAWWAKLTALRDRGAGGIVLFGGEAATLRARLLRFKAEAPDGIPPFVAADLERGVGQQVLGATHHPPAMAFGAADSVELAGRAGWELAQEALALGIDWVLGPVLDLADEPLNPIVGTRAFAADPERVARLGAAWLRGVQEGGALACAKHYPGHGATTDDSHEGLPVVRRSAEALRALDLVPFREAVEAGVATVMTAHVAYPALCTPERADVPATLNPDLTHALLRDELGFTGLVVTDALIMDGVKTEAGEGPGAVRAIEAGCDLLLYPEDFDCVVEALVRWAEANDANRARLRASVDRVLGLKALLAAGSAPTAIEPGLGDAVAAAAVTRIGPALPALAGPTAVVVIDDDDEAALGHELVATLVEGGVEVSPAGVGVSTLEGGVERVRAVVGGAARVVAVVGCRVRAWKGRAGLAPGLAEILRALPADRTTVAALCGPYPLRGALPEGAELLLGYGDGAAEQRALGGVLLGRAPAPGRLPVPAE